MSATAVKHWLIAYDIRCNRRLRRVHQYVSKRAIQVQYSVYGLEADDRRIRDILDDLQILIDSDVDDVRIYHLPESCPVWLLGSQEFPEGISLHATRVMRLLSRKRASASADPDSSPDPSASPCPKTFFDAER